MGKKVKIGKQRRDKYYKLAKEAGYRSRAAFKLIQLNKRFEFLQKSRATVDLCAAPGGWMQVAVQNMPVSSLVVGVDLAPIKPIKNCIALQGDITTGETRAAIKKELKTWSVSALIVPFLVFLQADCVLHDGAPNVGLNWAHDAFQQNCLTLSALKLATQILRKGGTFVTKVFRSNDYSCLIKVFEALFKRVHVWKPAASRLESAEIFVVCEQYLKPEKVGPEYLDPKKVFSNPDGSETKGPNVQNLLIGKTKKAKAEGYDTDHLAVFHTVTATEFITQGSYMDMLGVVNEIVLDDDKWKNSDKTTDEVREYIKDVKVCGPRELRVLLRWRKALKEEQKKLTEEEQGPEEAVEERVLTADEVEDEEMRKIDEEIALAGEGEKAALRKKKKKMLKEKAKLLKRRELKMIIDGDSGPQQEELELFSIMKIRKAQEMLQLKAGLEENDKSINIDDDEEVDDEEGVELEDEDEEEMEWEGEDAFKLQTKKKYEPSKEVTDTHTQNWFQQEEVSGLISDSDEEDDLVAVEKHLNKNKKADYSNTVSFENEKGKKKDKSEKKDADDGFDTKDSSDDDVSDDEEDKKEKAADKFDKEIEMDEDEEYFDVVTTKASKRPTASATSSKASGAPKAKKRKLTPEELALGEQLIYSSKSARELEEFGWNRYANNDDGLPDWFVEDEKKHYKKTPPVTKEQVAMYRERMKELNARPCKKVAQAKARKQRRVLRKMEAAKKKAEGILENDQMVHSEKIKEMKKVYSRANRNEYKKPEIVVMSKGKKGKVTRPNGRYKLVDSRMKKDLRAMKNKEKTKGRGKKGKGKGKR